MSKVFGEFESHFSFTTLRKSLGLSGVLLSFFSYVYMYVDMHVRTCIINIQMCAAFCNLSLQSIQQACIHVIK